MPGSIRMELDREIVNHLLTQHTRHYDLLREDPRFVRWLGDHRGAAGEKRLDRYIAEVRRLQPRKLSASAALANHSLPPPRSPPSPPRSSGEPSDQPPSRTSAEGPQINVLTGGAPAISYEKLQAALQGHLAALQLAMAACVNDYNEVTNPTLYAKLSQQFLATLAAMAQHTRRFHEDLNSHAFVDRVLTRALRDVAPEARAEFEADIGNIFQQSGGLAASGA